MAVIAIVAADGTRCVVEQIAACASSGYLCEALAGERDEACEPEIRLPDWFDSIVLRDVCEYMKLDLGVGEEGSSVLPACAQVAADTLLCFMKSDDGGRDDVLFELLELIRASSYLDIESLLQVSCLAVLYWLRTRPSLFALSSPRPTWGLDAAGAPISSSSSCGSLGLAMANLTLGELNEAYAAYGAAGCDLLAQPAISDPLEQALNVVDDAFVAQLIQCPSPAVRTLGLGALQLKRSLMATTCARSGVGGKWTLSAPLPLEGAKLPCSRHVNGFTHVTGGHPGLYVVRAWPSLVA